MNKLLSLITLIPLHFATIDLNFSELEYIADHLETEECRRLAAALHFRTHLESNSLDQAEQTIPKDIPCIQLLLHWNSAEGEGKGETHELLEEKLRQINKTDLADWLGRTVFRQLGHDLEDNLNQGLQYLENDSSTTIKYKSAPTLVPIIEIEDPKEWLAVDTILYVLLMVIVLALLVLCFKMCYTYCSTIAKKQKRKPNYYEMVEQNASESEEEKFNAIRQVESML